MELENYTLETFLNNFKKDKEVFGEDTKYIYEELFSAIMNREITINEKAIDAAESARMFGVISEEEIEKQIITEGLFSWVGKLFGKKNPVIDGLQADVAKAAAAEKAARKSLKAAEKAFKNQEASAEAVKHAQKMLEKATAQAEAANEAVASLGGLAKGVEADIAAGGMPPVDAIAGPEFMADPVQTVTQGGFFSRLGKRITNFFSGLKGKSFSDIMQNGFAWLNNPANMAKALTTTGGVVLVMIVLRALRKRRKMKQYQKLQQVQKDVQEESFEPELDFDGGINKFAVAKNKVLRECMKDEYLHEVLFGPLSRNQETVNYFDY